MMWLLLFLLMSCRIDTMPEVDPIVENTPEGIILEYTLEGMYKRPIGSQYEVYEIADQLRVYIQTGEVMDKIYEADYSYDDSYIIIGSDKFAYILGVDCITICGYTYYRF